MAWDKGQPGVGIKAKDLDDLIRTNNDALEAAIAQDHDFITGGTQTGKHNVITMQEQLTPGATAGSGNLATVDSGTQPELEFTSEDGVAVTLTSDGVMGSASTDITINDAVVAGTLSVTGATEIVDSIDVGEGDFTVDTDGNTTIAGTLNVTGAAEIVGITTVADKSVTKTTAVATAAAELANLATVDAQIAASADPAYTGGQSHTFPGGLTMKMGRITTGAASGTLSFTSPFDNNIVSVQLTIGFSAKAADSATVENVTVSSFDWNTSSSYTYLYWVAIGN